MRATQMFKLPGMTCLVFWSAVAMLMQGCASTGVGGVTEEGLQELNVETLEYVAIHPGADLATFIELYIEPVQLEFRRGWRPTTTGSRLTASQAQLDELRESLEASFMEKFREGLLANPRLRIAAEPGPGILRVTPRLKNVTIANPDGKANPGQAVSRKMGEVELEMLIHDVRTGTLVVRLEDRRLLTNEGGGFSVMGADQAFTEFAEIFHGWGTFTGRGIMNISPEAAPAR